MNSHLSGTSAFDPTAPPAHDAGAGVGDPDPSAPARPAGRSLQTRLLRYVAVGALAGALLTAALTWSVTQERASERVRMSLTDLVNAVQKTAAIGAFARDRILLQEVVEGIAHQNFALRVSILDPQGAPIVHAQRDPAQQIVQTPDSTVRAELHSPFDPKESLGTLQVDMDMAAIRAGAQQDALVFALAMALQTALVAALVYVLASRFVSQPITQLADVLSRLKAGTSRRLPTPAHHTDDELGALIHSTNRLLSANEDALGRERALRAEVQKMEAQYRKIFDTSSAGIFVLDAAGRLINSNPTALRLCAIEPSGAAPIEQFVDRAFRSPDLVRSLIERSLLQGSTAASDLQVRRTDGPDIWVHCLISAQAAGPDAAGLASPRIIEGVIYDITERKHAESAALHQAMHDGLTGLKNRVGTIAAIDQMLAESMMLSLQMTVMFIDLDGFKRINDQHGHEAGDQVLLSTATRLRQIVRRGSDVIGRIGGDEFVIALHGVGSDSPEISRIAGELVASLCQPMETAAGVRETIGASVGIASYPRHGVDRKQLLDAADIAMYEVKRHGKNAYVMAAPLALNQTLGVSAPHDEPRVPASEAGAPTPAWTV